MKWFAFDGLAGIRADGPFAEPSKPEPYEEAVRNAISRGQGSLAEPIKLYPVDED